MTSGSAGSQQRSVRRGHSGVPQCFVPGVGPVITFESFGSPFKCVNVCRYLNREHSCACQEGECLLLLSEGARSCPALASLFHSSSPPSSPALERAGVPVGYSENRTRVFKSRSVWQTERIGCLSPSALRAAWWCRHSGGSGSAALDAVGTQRQQCLLPLASLLRSPVRLSALLTV